MDEDGLPSWRGALRRALPIIIGVPLIVALCALLYIAVMASRDRERALQEQRQSYEVIALANKLDASIAKAETTLARYVISMDPDNGRLFQSQWRSASAELDALTRATRYAAWQKPLVKQLRAAFEDRGKMLADVGLRTTYDQKVGALGRFYTAGKADNLQQINQSLTTIIKAENARLAERSTAVDLAGDRTAWADQTWRLVGLVLLVGTLAAAWAANAAINERRADRRLAEAEMLRVDRLEAAVTARTAELRHAYDRLKQEGAERAAAEESLRQMQKMEAVGQLTGGIAHDFNNMLAVVVGGLELARRRLSENPTEARRHIDNAMEGANRASALTRRLLAFARAEPLLPTGVEPDSLIKGMVELIDRTIGDQIEVRLTTDAEGWAVFVDQHQLENAILNLAVNARDAMEGRGTLTIATSRVTLTAGEIGESVAGDYIKLVVADTGCGMSPEVLERVFEPFFTTKPVGRGTGLGLSQIFGFIRQCSGEIRILSQPGEGTQVELYLPRRILSPSAVADKKAGRAEPTMAEQPPVRILVVEDDPRVLAQTMDAIAELGHLPLACDRPADAAAKLAANPNIGLIISDVLMPEMTGPEMVGRLPEQSRGIPVLFVTGYAGDIEASAMFEGHPVLRKPYTLATLSRAISAAISGPHPNETAAAAE